jgi:hypothetical protein
MPRNDGYRTTYVVEFQVEIHLEEGSARQSDKLITVKQRLSIACHRQTLPIASLSALLHSDGVPNS